MDVGRWKEEIVKEKVESGRKTLQDIVIMCESIGIRLFFQQKVGRSLMAS